MQIHVDEEVPMRSREIMRLTIPVIAFACVPFVAHADDTTQVSQAEVDSCIDQCGADCADGVYGGAATSVKKASGTAKKAKKTGQVATAPTDITLPSDSSSSTTFDQQAQPDQATIDRIRAEERARAAEEFSADQQKMQETHDADVQKAREEERAAAQSEMNSKLQAARDDYNRDLARANSENDDVIKDAAITPMGLYGLVGGGATNFTEGGVTGNTEIGGYWDARVGIGTRSIIGAEVAYVGSSRDVTALGLNEDAYLLSNGVEGVARLNVPITPAKGKVLVEPFTFAGAGWQHYNVMTDSANTSDLNDNDDVLAIPMGVGLGLGLGGFTLDGRVTYRHTVGSDMFGNSTTSFDSDALNSWAAGGSLGFEF
jgi:hypothetical protein